MSKDQPNSDNSPTPSESPFFQPTPPSIPPAFSSLLEQYSQITKASQVKHVISLRNQAYKSHPYPCLGRWRFLDLDLSSHPLYQEYVLPTLKSDVVSGEEPLFLDFGCCLGQDLRKAIVDGAPKSRLYGSDILPAFIDTGYDLFLDQSKFPRDHFIAPADAFDDSPENRLARLDGKVSILHISAVFHLFGLEKQQQLALRCLRLLSRNAKRCLILGGQTANVDAGEYPRSNGRTRWRHNSESWEELWKKTAVEDGSCKVEVQSRLDKRVMTGNWKDHDVTGLDGQVTTERRKVIGTEEEGFRWMIWWVWVEFE